VARQVTVRDVLSVIDARAGMHGQATGCSDHTFGAQRLLGAAVSSPPPKNVRPFRGPLNVMRQDELVAEPHVASAAARQRFLSAVIFDY
jgi:hypothetical protein